MKVRDLLQKTNPWTIEHKIGCSPRKYRSFISTEKLNFQAIWDFIVKCNKEDSDPKGHMVRISLQDPYYIPNSFEINSLLNLEVNVSCTCPGFLYSGAWYNSKRNMYFEPFPFQRGKVIKPPESGKNKNLICKHIAVALPFSFKFMRDYFRELNLKELSTDEQKESV